MRYMLMICYDESFNPPETVYAETAAWDEEMDRRGLHRGEARLRPASDATTVRVRDDEVLLSDVPFAETKEQIVGYDLIECADLDEASTVVSPARLPASTSSCLTQFLKVSAVTPSSVATLGMGCSSSEAPTNRMASRRNSGGYGGLVLGTSSSSCRPLKPSLPQST